MLAGQVLASADARVGLVHAAGFSAPNAVAAFIDFDLKAAFDELVSGGETGDSAAEYDDFRHGRLW